MAFTPEVRQQFLSRVAAGASMHRAAADLLIDYLDVARARATDEQFAQDLDLARDVLRPMALEEVLIDQATAGIDKPLTYQGMKTGQTVRELVTSNPSLIAVLRANLREKYTERSEVVNPAQIAPHVAGESDRARLIEHLKARAAARAGEQPAAVPAAPLDGADLL